MELKPIIPFEPIRVDEFPEGLQWTAQVKWDGVRVLTYFDGHELRLFNRRLHERTHHYPELLNFPEYCSAKSVILDGEIIALRNGKPSFYQVMRRDGLRKLNNLEILLNKVPITYMIFDVLYLNGQWVTFFPLSERQQILQKIITPTSLVQLVENFDDAIALYEAVKEQEMEGIIMKDLSSTYLINGKDQRWRKKKYYRDAIAVVGGVTQRGAAVNSLLLGQFDQNGQLWFIGHAGTGKLSQKDWLELSEKIKPLIQSTMPFVNTPSRLKGTVWLKPHLCVKVQFAEWIKGHTLRQPSIQAFVDVPPHECLLKSI